MLAAITPTSNAATLDRALESNRENGTAIEFAAGNYTNKNAIDLLSRGLSGASNVKFGEGTFNINDNVKATIGDRGLAVNARGAKFVSQGVDGDLFRFQGADSLRNKRLTEAETEADKDQFQVDFSWTGGRIDISDSKVTVDDKLQRERDRVNNQRLQSNNAGTSSTADALSVVGRFGQSFEHGLENVTIRDVSIEGGSAKGSRGWLQGGGDSGIFVTDADNITIEDNNLSGLRDAGIYVTDKDGTGTESVNIRNNYVEDSYNGIAAKRGIDNTNITGNVSLDNVVGISFQPAATDKSVQSKERGLSRDANVNGNDIISSQNFDGLRLSGSVYGDFSGNNIYETSSNNSVNIVGTAKDKAGNDRQSNADIRGDNSIKKRSANQIDNPSDKIVKDSVADLETRRDA